MSVPRPWIVAPSMLARGRRPASHDPATCWLCTLDPVPSHGPGHGRPSRWPARAEVAVLAVELAKGHAFLPIGNCDNFDAEKGCQGHAG